MLTLGKGVERLHLLDLSQRPNQTLRVWFAQTKTVEKKNRCRVLKANLYLLHCLWTSYTEERGETISSGTGVTTSRPEAANMDGNVKDMITSQLGAWHSKTEFEEHTTDTQASTHWNTVLNRP